jgi:hypothetical protein
MKSWRNWWVDRHTRIVVRNRKACQLGVLQFAIFDALHRQPSHRGKQMLGSLLMDVVYRGVASPAGRNTICVSVQQANRKLSRLGLKIRGVNRKQHSFYQIVSLT